MSLRLNGCSCARSCFQPSRAGTWKLAPSRTKWPRPASQSARPKSAAISVQGRDQEDPGQQSACGQECNVLRSVVFAHLLVVDGQLNDGAKAPKRGEPGGQEPCERTAAGQLGRKDQAEGAKPHDDQHDVHRVNEEDLTGDRCQPREVRAKIEL